MKLSDAGDHLYRVFRDWKGLLANPEYDVRAPLVCWNNYRPSMMPEPVTFEDVAEVASDRQYSFQVAADGSVIQIFYRYDDSRRKIKQATLAYYQATNQPEQQELEEASAEEQPQQPPEDVEARPPGVGLPQWMRIDYKEGGSDCPIHADCHMHLSGFPETRITLSNLPSPKQFVEITFAWFYPEVYRRKRLTQRGDFKDTGWMRFVNRNSMPCEDKRTTKHFAHLRIPPIPFL